MILTEWIMRWFRMIPTRTVRCSLTITKYIYKIGDQTALAATTSMSEAEGVPFAVAIAWVVVCTAAAVVDAADQVEIPLGGVPIAPMGWEIGGVNFLLLALAFLLFLLSFG